MADEYRSINVIIMGKDSNGNYVPLQVDTDGTVQTN